MINKLTTEMIKYYKGDPKRINHFLKVFSYSKFIGMNENLYEKTISKTARMCNNKLVKLCFLGDTVNEDI